MLRGYIERVTTDLIEGWAQNVDHPEAPVCLDIYADGRLIGQVLANRYRADLAPTGIGGGHHSFAFAPPAGSPSRLTPLRCVARLTVRS